jgi:hypothetical protein
VVGGVSEFRPPLSQTAEISGGNVTAAPFWWPTGFLRTGVTAGVRLNCRRLKPREGFFSARFCRRKSSLRR